MSFQDIGKTESLRKPRDRSGHGFRLGTNSDLCSTTISVDGSDFGRDYTSISQSILQYQQNVGILSKMIKNIGTNDDGLLLKQQFKIQSDAIRELGAKIESQLLQQDWRQGSILRSDASENRATHVKLSRDYQWIEKKFENFQLEWKQRRNAAEAKRIAELDYSKREEFQHRIESDHEKLQIQLQNQRVTEEIMREREEEVLKINMGVHQVNEIYKDLASIVSNQQDQVDEVEAHMEAANKNADSGLKEIERASAKSTDSSCVIA